MAQTTLSIRMDEDVKREFDAFCSAVGMNTSVAINLFAKTVIRERRIPFEISLRDDPFYGGSNTRRLQKSAAQLERGEVISKSLEELEAAKTKMKQK